MKKESTINTGQCSADQLFQIKNRFTDKVIFELKCASLKVCVEAAVKAKVSLVGASLDGASLDGASLVGASLDGASLDGASLDRASLYRASLVGASLVGASLDGASLDGASLDGASLDGADGKKTIILKTPIQISGLRWHITIFDNDMRIGCEYHSLSDWWLYDDLRISKMDCRALDFWKQNKTMLQGVCKATGRLAGEMQP